jgi:hypothetical protein
MHLLRRRTARARRNRRGFSANRFTGREQIRLKDKTGGGRGRSSCRRFFVAKSREYRCGVFRFVASHPFAKKREWMGHPASSCRRFFCDGILAPERVKRGMGVCHAAPNRVSRLNHNGTAADADSNSVCSALRHRVKRSRTGCPEARQSGIAGLLKRMTKVISWRSDEGGGCRNAFPE